MAHVTSSKKTLRGADAGEGAWKSAMEEPSIFIYERCAYTDIIYICASIDINIYIYMSVYMVI